MKKLTLFLLSFCLFSSLQAAELPRLKILLQDSVTRQAVPYASLSLRSHHDSLLLAGRTDKEGAYVFQKLNEGIYRLKVNAVGYNELDTLLQIGSGVGQTCYLNLRSSSLKINEVTVIGTRKAYEQKYDRKVYTMTEAQKATARTVLDLLKTLPGVIVNDEDKSITYRGVTPTMQVNELPAQFMYPDLSVIPAEKVKKIELIDSNRGGSLLGGTINILLVKPNKEGLDGVLSSEVKQAEISHSFGQEHLLNLNYGVGKNILFGNFLFNYKNTHDLSSKSGYSLNSITGKEDILQSDTTKNDSRRFNGYLGNMRLVDSLRTDYYLLSVVPASGNSFSNSYVSRGSLNYLSERTVNNQTLGFGAGYGMIKKFKKPDEMLDWSIYINTPSQNKTESATDFLYSNGSLLNIVSQEPGGSNYGAFSLYFSNPLKNGFNFSLSENSAIGNLYSETNRWRNQIVDTLNLGRDMGIGWNDNLSLNIGRMVKKVRYEVGLSFNHSYKMKDYTRYLVVSNDTNFVLKKHYFSVNPTANFTWHCSETSDFSLRYAYSTYFPSLELLNSYVNKRGVYAWSTGNPDLKSSHYHNFSLGYTYSREKFNLSTDLVYSQSNNEIAIIGYYLPNNISLVKPVNIGSSKKLGVVFTNWIQLSPRFSMINSATLNYNQLDKSNLKKEAAAFGLDGEKFVFTQFNYNLNTYITCKINKKNFASLRVNYYSKNLQHYGYRKPWISSSVNYTRKFLKNDRLKMILSIDNFTYGLIDKVAVNNNMGTYTTAIEDPSASRRTYKISFTYIFNKGDKGTKKLQF